MDYLFFLDDLPIEEPIGWQDFELSLKRDDKTHGMQFEASTGALKFYGAAAQYLIDQYKAKGIKADVVFTAQEFCNDPYSPFEEITGRLNFGKMKKNCGAVCMVDIPMEEEGCQVVFKNRYDNKVDMDSLAGSDGFTPLQDYAAMGITMEMPAKALQSAVDGSVSEEDNVVDFNETIITADAEIMVRPNYSIERYNNIHTGQLTAVSNWDSTGTPDFPISPQLLFDDVIECFAGNFSITSRMKGSLNLIHIGGVNSAEVGEIYHQILRWDATGNIFDNSTIIAQELIQNAGGASLPYSLTFDNTLSVSAPLPSGEGLYAVLRIVYSDGLGDAVHHLITFDDASFFTLQAVKECPVTTADAYLAHETLSRAAESITNGCVRVKSSYYGRIDSQPFSFDEDGCGGLRLFTSGLKLRNAPDGRFFASMKELYEGLNPIDNIGFDIIPDPDNQFRYIMRIEKVDFFYQDEEIFSIDNIPAAGFDVQEQMHFAKISVGYKKWEVEGVNGLDEFNSTREYRTSLDTVSSPLDIISNLVAGSYPYEITRQQNFADSGAADTKFDNDIFILTLLRNAYDFEVEQGNVINASGFFDPAGIINAKLSPLRNLMRWYKTIAAGYANLSDSANKLFFSAGTGNFTAAMEVQEGAYDAECKIEKDTIAENQNLFVTHFARESDYTPLWRNELESFDYPLNIAEYKAIKETPYGYISYRCGNTGEFEKGFIKEIKFKPARGLANFTLLKKWE